MTNALLWIILLLVAALAAEMVNHLRANERADALAAERDQAIVERDEALRRTDHHMEAARRILRDALNSPNADVRRNADEVRHFADLPRNGQIRTVDDFLRDLFGGR